MTVMCQGCKELTACRCPIKWTTETPYGPTSTVEETIPSPLSDYFLNILKDYQPLFPLPNFTPTPPHIMRKRERIDFIWREHIENTFKCPNGHVTEIGADWDGSVTVYCRDTNCDYNKFGVEL